MFYLIYKTTNTIDGKYYIGCHQTTDINDGYYGSGKYLSRAIKKYGIESFHREILHICDTKEDMFTKEREIVNEVLVRDEKSYNLKIGGSGGNPGIVGAFTGRKHSEATKDKIRKKASNQIITEETRIKLSKNNWAKRNPEAQRQHAIAISSKPKSAEHRQKISASLRGRIWTSGSPHPNTGKVKTKVTCPHCGQNGAIHVMKRWHYDNCKNMLR